MESDTPKSSVNDPEESELVWVQVEAYLKGLNSKYRYYLIMAAAVRFCLLAGIVLALGQFARLPVLLFQLLTLLLLVYLLLEAITVSARSRQVKRYLRH